MEPKLGRPDKGLLALLDVFSSALPGRAPLRLGDRGRRPLGRSCPWLTNVDQAVSKLVCPIRSQLRGVRVRFGAEVAKYHERLDRRGVLEGNSIPGSGFGTEDFVLGQLVEADQLRTIEAEFVDSAPALNGNQAEGPVVLDSAFGAGIDGQFLGAEQLFAFDAAIDDPPIDIPFPAGVSHRDRFEVMVFLEGRI